MGDLRVCSRPPSGIVATEDRPRPVSLFSSLPPPPLRACSSPDPSVIEEDRWAVAEETAREVIGCVHPTLDSEEKRKDVIDYVQRLIRCSLGCEVFPYGSVPLKTFLPHGDIDLTALSSPTIEETLAHDVLAVLQEEEQNENAEYEVKDTEFIDAEVKLVKCIVHNIEIDISFNQLGGLCTLCFLEQVDRLVGKDHLFKRSIILVKAWCYYESRILGAHHGLISTYALETLVLYIFHLFHRSLNGPLAVLYRFLDYFSKFDWDNYCISLQGPVRKSSLPEIITEMPADVGDNLMLSEEFLSNCIDMFSVPSWGLETNVRAFPQKFLNIIDPLKENNNLGRSVSRGNFYRIRGAFKYGARKLGQILLLPRARIANEIKKFFSNTLERHLQKSSDLSSLSPSFEEEVQLNLVDLVLDNNIPGLGNSELYRSSTKDNYMKVASKMACSTDGSSVSGSHLDGEVSSRIISDTSDCSPSNCDLSDSLSGIHCYPPKFSLSGSSGENGKLEMFCEEWLDEKMGFDSWIVVDEKTGSDPCMGHRSNNFGASRAVCSCTNHHDGLTSSFSGILSPDASISEALAFDFRESDSIDIAGSLEAFNLLSDLSGDYDSHIRSLLYGQCCHGYALYAPTLPNAPTFPSHLQNKRPWNTVRRSMPIKQGSHMTTNGVVLGSTYNSMNNSKPFNCLRSEEKRKAQGTGTFFPKSELNGCSCRERSPQGRVKKQASDNHRQVQRHTRINGGGPTLPEKKLSREGTLEVPRGGKSGLNSNGDEFCISSKKLEGLNSNGDEFCISSKKLEFGSLGQLSEQLSLTALEKCYSWGSTPSLVLKVKSSKTEVGNNDQRVAKKSLQLKNEDEFPPLTA
ncbi:hypothetical protein RHMOL_Rhmol13G0075700 [Rhododendron molle]|uniref:Uncharacterized protein n=1 Tax=Rhododendron molle TaxID=49168 RepID=A0ACC0L4I7_RHOML|nr:hypothetical protein RHMOL_Rhmol13G0075700 [Rhododendron molle]